MNSKNTTKSASSHHIMFIHKDDDKTIAEIQAIVNLIQYQIANLIKDNKNIEDVWTDFDNSHTTYLNECIKNEEL